MKFIKFSFILINLLVFISCSVLKFYSKDEFNKLKNNNNDVSKNTTYKYFLYLGDNGGNVINKYEIDMSTGSLSNRVDITNPQVQTTYIAIAPSKKYLYASVNTNNGIQYFTINSPDGSLTPINFFTPSYIPDGPILISPNGQYLYGKSQSGTFCAFNWSINSTNGVLSLPNNLVNAIYINQPKDIAIKPTGDFAYIVNYLGGGFVSWFNISTGSLMPLGTISFPNGRAIVVHPTMNFLYVSDSVTPSIQSFPINPLTGTLSSPIDTDSTGANPSFLIIDPSGKYLYCTNSSSNEITGYSIQSDGSLISLTGSPYTASSYYYIAIDPTGKYLYAPMNSGNIDGFLIQSNGSLSALGGWTHTASNASNPVIIGIQQ
jgi:6-phosphogluconolactonase